MSALNSLESSSSAAGHRQSRWNPKGSLWFLRLGKKVKVYNTGG